MTRNSDLDASKKALAHTLFIRLALPPYTIHFKSPTYLRAETLDLLDQRVCKETLRATAQEASVREAIGKDGKFWSELVVLLRAAIPSLERRSFHIWDPSAVDYESTTGGVIAGNYPGLWKDLERLNEVVSISRNVLTVGEAAQELAARHAIDSEIFRLVNCCVRVTARGFDGDAGTGDEEKWQWVVNAYKKLLITSLQFLNNLVAQHEQLKLSLWVSLFDNSPDSITDTGIRNDIAQIQAQRQHDLYKPPPAAPPAPVTKPEPPVNTHDILLAYGTTGPTQRLSPLELEAAQPINPEVGFRPLPPEAQKCLSQADYRPNAWTYFVNQLKPQAIRDFHTAHNRSPMLGEISKNMPHYWYLQSFKSEAHMRGTRNLWEYWQMLYEEAAEKYIDQMDAWDEGRKQIAAAASKPLPVVEQKVLEPPPPPPKKTPPEYSNDPKAVKRRVQELQAHLTAIYSSNNAATITTNTPQWDPTTTNLAEVPDFEDQNYNPLDPHKVHGIFAEKKRGNLDLRMHFTAEAGAKILESGKGELMRRLEGYEGRRHRMVRGAAKRAKEDWKMGRRRSEGWVAGLTDAERAREQVEEDLKTEQVLQEVFAEENLPSDLFPTDRDPPDRDGSVLDDEEEEDESAENDSDSSEDDEDYPESAEDGRGLLTDVPLILGPSEIEVLPMLIMSGIVVAPPPPEKWWVNDPFMADGAPPPHVRLPFETIEGKVILQEAHTLRTHLLLSQTSGRNLLRELLIFVAAWDLREEELYFKFMVKITESILRAGLMPYAYHCFRDRSKSKDIISPAQAVIMKLLTAIYRARAATARSELEAAVRYKAHEKISCTQWFQPGERIPLPDDHPVGYITYPTWIATTAHAPTAVDLKALGFVFTEFRQHIIPQTCALIFLQGQIHHGRARAEDFPLNLWDMERMYEGVYQFLEFFAVLTEEFHGGGPVSGLGGPVGGVGVGGLGVAGQGNGHAGEPGTGVRALGPREVREGVGSTDFRVIYSWKKILGEWEMASELVTLLRELEGGIPKLLSGVHPPVQPQGVVGKKSQTLPVTSLPAISAMPQQQVQQQQRSLSADATLGGVTQLYTVPSAPAPVAVERPFDLDAEDATLPPLPLQPKQPSAFEPEHPLAYPEDTPILGHGQPGALPPGGGQQDQDEPSDFEWRNLKKLTVLVLSSLLYKNHLVQEQVRQYGGLEALVSCCRPDEHNPYIREHAIMCLRFAIEGHSYNTKVVREMSERDTGWGPVPPEVLDTEGFETFVDGKGQVGLRRRGNTSLLPPKPAGTASGIQPPEARPNASATASKISASENSMPKMSPERAAELMQDALRALPLSGDKLVTDRQKAEALARLDRAFESTEKALGRGGGSGTGNGGGGNGGGGKGKG